MRLTSLETIACALALLTSTPVLAQNVLENLSIGHTSRSGPDVPNWTLLGNDNSKLRVLSDRIVLTPPWPGNKRGSMWAQNQMPSVYWTAELEFRVSGPPGGAGNLNLWYTKDRGAGTELASIYTVDKFDGLALVLDQYSGTAGTLRGFLNDGATSYKSGLALDKLAFSHCPYPYRNLGRFSKMKIRQGADGLEVTIDDKPCFKSDKITLPSNYYFGITAASADHADSFEISTFIVRSDGGGASPPPNQQNPNQAGGAGQFAGQANQQPVGGQMPPPSSQPPPPQAEDLRSVFTTLQQLQASVQDLSNRLSTQSSEIQNLANKPVSPASGGGISADAINAMARRIEQIEKDVGSVKHSLDDRDFMNHLQEVHDRMEDIQHHMESALPSTRDLAQILKTSSPRLGFFLFIILAFQGMLAASYIVYKRRRANSPKKLL